MKSRSYKEMVRAFAEVPEDLKIRRIKPGLNFMDNEGSTAFKMTMTTIYITYQLVTPTNHRANNAERVIQTFKKHFIEGLCIVDRDFHLQLWNRLLQQATISVNLLIQSRIITRLSDYNYIFGEFDYNRTPLAPQEIRIVIHNRPNYRASWAPHGEDVWYIGP